MPEFILHTPDTAPEDSRATLAEVTSTWGFTPRMHATLAESPAALVGYETLWGRIAGSSLTPVEQQVAFHTFLSRQAGMDEDTVARLRADQAPADPRLAALWSFTREVALKRGHAATAVPAFLAAGFSRANVLDVVAIIACKVIANFTAELAGVPDEDFMSDPALAWTPATTNAA